ncbi:MAG: hypothetical protein AAF125_19785, partial [Chloroflexota bacterium]
MTFSWESEGIQSLQLNFEDTVGSGEEAVCQNMRGRPPMRFNVTFPDGAQRDLDVEADYLVLSPIYRLLFFVAWATGFVAVVICVRVIARWTTLRTPNPWTLMGLGALLAMVIASYTLRPVPYQLTEQIDSTQVEITASRTQLFSVGNCTHLSWTTANIAELYVNGSGRIGTGDEIVCLTGTNLSVTVVLPDDTEQVYLIPVTFFAYQTGFWVVVMLTIGLLLVGGYALLRPIDRLAGPSAWFIEWVTLPLPVVFLGLVSGRLLMAGSVAFESLVGLMVAAVIVSVIAWGWLRRDLFASLGQTPNQNTAERVHAGLFVLPLLFYVPVITMAHAVPSVQLAYDGRPHYGILQSLVQGGLPVENPWLAGDTLNLYWLYHTYIAGFMGLLRLPPFSAMVLVQVILLSGAFYWALQLVRALRVPGGFLTGVGMLVVLHGSNLLASYFLLEAELLKNVVP